MKTQTTTSQMYCSSAAMRYAQVLYELNVPKEAIQKAREIFEEVPQLHDVFVNPTIPAPVSYTHLTLPTTPYV